MGDLGSQSHLLTEFDGPDPHTLVVQASRVGGDMVQTMMVSDQDLAAQWDSLVISLDGEEPPITDTYPPRVDDDFRELRALVWSRCREHSSAELPEFVELADAEPDGIVNAFAVGGGRGDDVGRRLAHRFLDYGEGYFRSSPCAWSPDGVGLFLSDWLPLRADDGDALPDVLEERLQFALNRRGVEQRWIEPVIDAVAEFTPDFEDAFDDDSAWVPSKEVAAALLERGVAPISGATDVFGAARLRC